MTEVRTMHEGKRRSPPLLTSFLFSTQTAFNSSDRLQVSRIAEPGYRPMGFSPQKLEPDHRRKSNRGLSQGLLSGSIPIPLSSPHTRRKERSSRARTLMRGWLGARSVGRSRTHSKRSPPFLASFLFTRKRHLPNLQAKRLKHFRIALILA